MEVASFNNRDTSAFRKTATSFIAGGLAGCCAKTVIAPLDRVKILFQTRNPHLKSYFGSWSGPFRALAYIYRTEGFLGVYRGNSATLLRIFPYAAIQYTSFEHYRGFITELAGKEYPVTKLIAGSMAGATSVAFTYPLDLMRTRLAYQVADTPRQNVITALQLTYRADGFRKLYRGLGPTLLGIIPYAGVSFFTYHTLKGICMSSSIAKPKGRKNETELSIPVRLACGAIAGAFGQTSSYPLDIVRRRMQAQGLSASVPFYRNTIDAILSIWKSQGWRGFYIGLTINYIKVIPAVSISFVSYEVIRKRLEAALY